MEAIRSEDRFGTLIVEFTGKATQQAAMYVVGEIGKAIARQCIEKPSLREIVESISIAIRDDDGRLYGMCVPTNVTEEMLKRSGTLIALDGPDAAVESKRPPLAAAVLLKRGELSYRWVVPECPYCGKEHIHGAGENPRDVNSYLGHRVAHCSKDDLNGVNVDAGYRLVAKESEESQDKAA